MFGNDICCIKINVKIFVIVSSRKMNIAVLEMAETGELFKLEQKWWVNKGECGATDSGVSTNTS